jgi:hypothetical protein
MDVDNELLLFVPKLNFKIHIICIAMDENTKFISHESRAAFSLCLLCDAHRNRTFCIFEKPSRIFHSARSTLDVTREIRGGLYR